MQHMDESVGSRTAALHSGTASGMRRTRIETNPGQVEIRLDSCVVQDGQPGSHKSGRGPAVIKEFTHGPVILHDVV